MKAIIYVSHTKKFDTTIADSLQNGAAKCGDELHQVRMADWKHGLVARVDDACDLAFIVGVKSGSPQVWDAYQDAGKKTAVIDKGYTRMRGGPLGTLYWRISVNAFQPLPYFMNFRRPSDRWDATGRKVAAKWSRTPEDPHRKVVIFCGGSQKYCNWHGLGGATEYAKTVLDEMTKCKQSGQTVVYRPKPSWGGAVPIDDYRYSHPKQKLESYFPNCHCVVTFGSNAALEAICAGVPSVILGDGIAKPVCGTRIADVVNPPMMDRDKIKQWLYNLAHCQWSVAEMADGSAWRNIREVMEINTEA